MNVLPTYIQNYLSRRFPKDNLRDYLGFIEAAPRLQPSDRGHNHHIVPRKVAPEYGLQTDNIIRISYEDHLKAHLYLAWCLPLCHVVQVAFFQMVNEWAEYVDLSNLWTCPHF